MMPVVATASDGLAAGHRRVLRHVLLKEADQAQQRPEPCASRQGVTRRPLCEHRIAHGAAWLDAGGPLGKQSDRCSAAPAGVVQPTAVLRADRDRGQPPAPSEMPRLRHPEAERAVLQNRSLSPPATAPLPGQQKASVLQQRRFRLVGDRGAGPAVQQQSAGQVLDRLPRPCRQATQGPWWRVAVDVVDTAEQDVSREQARRRVSR